MVLSATFLLIPGRRRSSAAADLRRVKSRFREMQYHPERFLDAAQLERTDIAAWVESKRQWTNRQLPRGRRGQRHQAIVTANTALRAELQPAAEQTAREQQRLRRRLPLETMLDSREYPFCLFSSRALRTRLLDVYPTSA